MRIRFFVCIIAFVYTLPNVALGVDSGEFLSLQKRIVEIFKENNSAMLRIKVAVEKNDPEKRSQLVIGSGFFVSKTGHVLTNASLLQNPSAIWVEHEGISYVAELLGKDHATNLALLQIEKLPAKFEIIRLSDSPHMPELGSMVVRLSMPLDFPASPSMGLVTGIESRFSYHFFPCTWMRTSVISGPGEGGSPYMDLTGRFAGIQVYNLPDVQSTYILPARAVMRVYHDLISDGKMTYAWIGFEVAVEGSSTNGKRLVLSEIIKGTPAEQLGLQVGDVLETIGDYSIRSVDDLRNAMFYTQVNEYVSLSVLRDGKVKDFTVRAILRPDNEPREVVREVVEPNKSE